MDTPINTRRQEQIDRKVIEQAAEWFTLFEDEAGERERAAFAQWMTQSPLHVRAFLEVSATERTLEGIAPGLLSATFQRDPVDHGNVIALAEISAENPRQSSKRKRIIGFAVAAAMTATLALWWTIPALRGWERFTTTTGEQRSVELQDGSVVHMNAQSRLEVRLSAKRRELRLLDGEALFRVHGDPARPFRVHVDAAVIQALGTQFNVDRRSDRTTVSVIEGSVRVSPPVTAQQTNAVPEILTAGQAVNIAANGEMQARKPMNVEQVSAWRQRRLVFEEDTLADIAAQFNRYNRTPQIEIEDGPIRQRRYAAVFDADDPESLLQFLRRDRDLALENRGERLVIRQRKDF